MNYCKCGCKIKVKNLFVSGHNSRVKNYFTGLNREGSNNPMFGKKFKHSDDYKKRMSIIRFGRKLKPHSTETKIKISLSKIGKKASEETKLKMSESRKKLNLTGEKCVFWKGGITKLHLHIRSCSKYNEWRKAIFQRDNYTCRVCNKISKGDIEADHIKPFSIILKDFLAKYSTFSSVEDKETLLKLAIEYEPFWCVDNGRTLCKSCHKKTDTYGNKNK